MIQQKPPLWRRPSDAPAVVPKTIPTRDAMDKAHNIIDCWCGSAEDYTALTLRIAHALDEASK